MGVGRKDVALAIEVKAVRHPSQYTAKSLA
jgi:hypothetical protein